MNVIKATKPNGVPPKALSQKKAAAEPPDGALVDLEVWSVPAINRQLLICHRPGHDGSDPTQLVSVGVRDNTLFLKKMRLRARPVTDKRFNLEGPLPRRRGCW